MHLTDDHDGEMNPPVAVPPPAAARVAAIRAAAARIRERLDAAAVRAGRSPDAIQLIAVTKGFGPEVAIAAAAAGLTQLGESRIQEARSKIPAVEEAVAAAGVPPPAWHLIGHLQTNKAGPAARLFDWIHSLDSLRVAEAVAARRQGAPLRALVQIKTSSEPTKAGLEPARALEVVPRIAALAGLEVRGLMTVAPLSTDPAAARRSFRALAALAARLAALRAPRLRMLELSMGMSADFEIAVEEGATLVRLGTALFGVRRPAP